MTREELEINVVEWANIKGLLSPDNAKNQVLKAMAELGELADEILKNDRKNIILELGDVEVCLTILKEQLGLTQDECLDNAWNKIKDRTGKTVRGTFIKD